MLRGCVSHSAGWATGNRSCSPRRALSIARARRYYRATGLSWPFPLRTSDPLLV